MAYTEAGFPVRHPIQTFFVISALRRNLSSSVVGMDDLFIEGRGWSYRAGVHSHILRSLEMLYSRLQTYGVTMALAQVSNDADRH